MRIEQQSDQLKFQGFELDNLNKQNSNLCKEAMAREKVKCKKVQEELDKMYSMNHHHGKKEGGFDFSYSSVSRTF